MLMKSMFQINLPKIMMEVRTAIAIGSMVKLKSQLEVRTAVMIVSDKSIIQNHL